ncbi:hypothetical protein NW768_001091 [Fusarium equiseti]|uniref:Ubiquitin-like domain-containing protein n=1 Tax=Fusarium equiseti TaxID=61235 RepID=A0ABQ8RPG1_FUSEQ|nr:hypothetical protein NW768_001091 [Fusarium equiseti]
MLEHLTPWSPTTKVRNGFFQMDDLEIHFRRTLRVPKNRDSNDTPKEFGHFVLYKVDDYAGKLPLSMAQEGGLFIPMYQRDAMWITFKSEKRYAIKIFWGGINAISGEPVIPNDATDRRRRNRIRQGESIQDYIIVGVNGQDWLDALAVEPGKVRQIVPMPVVSGPWVESQMTSQEPTEEIQFEVTRLDPEEPEEIDHNSMTIRMIAQKGYPILVKALPSTTIAELKLIYERRRGIPVNEQRLGDLTLLKDRHTLAYYNITDQSVIYVDNPAGGLINQGIVKIPRHAYQKTVPVTFNLQILNKPTFKRVTGKRPYPCPIKIYDYSSAMYPFLSTYEEPKVRSYDFQGSRSVDQTDEVSDESIPANIEIGAVGLLNPRGSSQELELEWEMEERLGDVQIIFRDDLEDPVDPEIPADCFSHSRPLRICF